MAGFIPDDKVADVRNAANVVDVISEYIDLKKTGKNFLGLCPFHAEKKPSFTVNEEKQIFHCFGCGQGGNVLTFVMLYHNLNFPEAVRFLANKYGIEKPASLQEVLERYHAGLPIRPRYAGSSLGDYVFDASFDRLWTNWNYVSVLSGKDILPSAGVPAVELRSTSMERAEAELARVERETKELLSKSATHREYIDSMRKEKS